MAVPGGRPSISRKRGLTVTRSVVKSQSKTPRPVVSLNFMWTGAVNTEYDHNFAKYPLNDEEEYRSRLLHRLNLLNIPWGQSERTSGSLRSLPTAPVTSALLVTRPTLESTGSRARTLLLVFAVTLAVGALALAVTSGR